MKTHAGWAIVFLCAGCGGGQMLNKNTSSVGNLFTFSADFKGGYSGTETDSWQPTTQQAWVTWDGTAITAGKVGLNLFDANGVGVGGESVTSSSVPVGQATTVGTPGQWRVL